jgi:Ras-related GTP-binding protein A/B
MNKTSNTTKILLMGKQKVGKTSMRSMIFSNTAPKDTCMLEWTNEVNESRIKFMGCMTLNLFDCGGQPDFMKNYFELKRPQIFTNVGILIFVLEALPLTSDVQSEDLIYYEE